MIGKVPMRTIVLYIRTEKYQFQFNNTNGEGGCFDLKSYSILLIKKDAKHIQNVT